MRIITLILIVSLKQRALTYRTKTITCAT